MFSKLIKMIKDAIQRMISSVSGDMVTVDISSTISDKMQKAIEKWLNIYENNPPWNFDGTTHYTCLGIGGQVCSELARSVMLEFDSNILDLDYNPDDEINIEDEPKTRAQFLNQVYKHKLVPKLRTQLEYGMATGGLVIKPYLKNNKICFDFSMQGEFIPIAFDDDGNITDIAFISSFISGKKRYTKVERHTFDEVTNTVTVQNKAYVSENAEEMNDLGTEIELSRIEPWKDISAEPVTLENVKAPLYGYYRFPRANNVDEKSPLGASAFSRAIDIIEKADKQFNRLDWEYHAGQMAINADPTLLEGDYFGSGLNYRPNLPEADARMYRKVNTDDMFDTFAPALRDTNYQAGLNSYLVRIEDLCELSRGTISNPEIEARTATELKILKQRAYSNIQDNQNELERCLESVIYAMSVYCDLYNLFPSGEYTTAFSWDDSVIVDRETQLQEQITLCNEDILSKAEVRSWYTGESLEKAQATIDEISESKSLANDIFTMGGEDVNDPQDEE